MNTAPTPAKPTAKPTLTKARYMINYLVQGSNESNCMRFYKPTNHGAKQAAHELVDFLWNSLGQQLHSLNLFKEVEIAATMYAPASVYWSPISLEPTTQEAREATTFQQRRAVAELAIKESIAAQDSLAREECRANDI